MTTLANAAAGNGKRRPRHPRFDRLNTPFLERLAQAGAPAETIDIVVLTHLHVDHVGWCTRGGLDGDWRPTFPKARHLLPLADLDDWLKRAGTTDDWASRLRRQHRAAARGGARRCNRTWP